MKQTTIYFFLLAFLGIGLFNLGACSSDQPTDNGDSRLPAIYGRVLDAAGNPVANAGVSLLFSYASHAPGTASPTVALSPNPATSQSNIKLTVPQSGQVNIMLLRADTRAVVDTIADGVFASGQHTRTVDVSNLPNLRYIVQYKTPNDSGEINLMVHKTQFPITAPFTRTDSNGLFVIPFASVSIGKLFEGTFETGVTSGWMEISNLLDIAIDGPGTSDITWSLKADTTAVIDSTLRLP
jgi:hypothetical protein